MALFLAWTGARISASDLLHLGLAHRFVPHTLKKEVVADLTELAWTDDPNKNKSLIDGTLARFAQALPGSAPLEEVEKEIEGHFSCDDKAECFKRMKSWKPRDEWVGRQIFNFQKASPLSAHLIWDHLRRSQGLTAKEVFILEWSLAVRTVHEGDFLEGVRALLIEKDQAPQWKYKTWQEVPQSVVDGILTPWKRGFRLF